MAELADNIPWTSPVRLYRLADGTVVEESAVTDRAELLVGAGGRLPRAEADRLGLIKRYRAPAPAESEPEAKAQAAPPANKAQAAPKATK